MPLFIIYAAIIILILKDKERLAYLLSAAAILIITLKTDMKTVIYLRYILNGFVFGFILAFALKKECPVFYIIVLTLIPDIIFLLCILNVDIYKNDFITIFQEALNIFKNSSGNKDLISSLDGFNLNILFPYAEIFKHIITTFIIIYVAARFLKKKSKYVLHKYIVPDNFIWIFIAGLFSVVLGILKEFGIVVFLSAFLIYVLNGFSIVRLFFFKSGNNLFLEYFYYFTQPFLMFLPSFIIGIAATWVNFRKKILSINKKNKGV